MEQAMLAGLIYFFGGVAAFGLIVASVTLAGRL
jgi:hypothetical protein